MKTAKELRKQFTNETGCGTSNFNGDGYYPDYTEWLENKIITSEKKEIKPTIEGEKEEQRDMHDNITDSERTATCIESKDYRKCLTYEMSPTGCKGCISFDEALHEK